MVFIFWSCRCWTGMSSCCLLWRAWISTRDRIVILMQLKFLFPISSSSHCEEIWDLLQNRVLHFHALKDVWFFSWNHVWKCSISVVALKMPHVSSWFLPFVPSLPEQLLLDSQANIWDNCCASAVQNMGFPVVLGALVTASVFLRK